MPKPRTLSSVADICDTDTQTADLSSIKGDEEEQVILLCGLLEALGHIEELQAHSASSMIQFWILKRCSCSWPRGL